jgi:5-methylcytosine-specific restriction endonuclease McrA
MMGDTLVLNTDGQPVSVTPLSVMTWQDAIKSIWIGSVKVVEEYDDWVVRSPSMTMRVPSVVMTKYYIDVKKSVGYKKENIFLRDHYQCQYCHKKFPEHLLTIDHVHPQSKGGASVWENVATSCSPCNNKRGNNGSIMPLNKPYRPSYYKLVELRKQYPIVVPHQSWVDYLDWDESKIKVIARKKSFQKDLILDF